MKRTFVLLIFLLVIPYSFASARDSINYFTVKSTIAQPVTIKTNLGDFSFFSSYTLHGHISRLEAFDANGNRIVNTQPQKKSVHTGTDDTPNEYWYIFSDIYGSSTTQDYKIEDVSPKKSSNNVKSSYKPKATYAGNVNDVNKYISMADVGIGYGTIYGGGIGANFAARTLWGVVGIAGGVGKSIPSPDYNGVNWYFALTTGLFGFSLEAGPVCKYYHAAKKTSIGIALLMNYERLVYGPFGVGASVGFSQPTDNSIATSPNFEFSLGVRYRLGQH